MSEITIELADAEATEALGAQLAACSQPGAILFLYGNLGAGKTSLVRGFLRALGHQGAVKSPTYTLVENYHIADRLIYHFDLYRLSDPEELEYLGIRDYFSADAITLVEWPEQGGQLLPKPDLSLHLEYALPGRKVLLVAGTAMGQEILACLPR